MIEFTQGQQSRINGTVTAGKVMVDGLGVGTGGLCSGIAVCYPKRGSWWWWW